MSRSFPFDISVAARSGIALPNHKVDLSPDEALAAQNSAFAGAMLGGMNITGPQFSSLVTELMRQNLGEDSPITSVIVWFEHDQIFLEVELANGAVMGLVGNIEVDKNYRLVADLEQAGFMGLVASEPLLNIIEVAINRIFDDLILAGPLDIQVEDEILMLGLAQ